MVSKLVLGLKEHFTGTRLCVSDLLFGLGKYKESVIRDSRGGRAMVLLSSLWLRLHRSCFASGGHFGAQ